jgi:lipopolysaccharide biosynthesis glycosyltransferase
VLACDDHYAPHALVVLRSLLSSTPIHDLQLLLLSSLSSVWEQRLHALVGASGASLEIVPLRQLLEQPALRQLASQLDQSSVPHTSAAALARLQAGQLLPSHCRRALYLDCDLVVQADLSALLEHPLAGQPLAAVPDALLTRMGHQRLRFPSTHTYVNSGVLLIDLDHWRRLDLDAAAIAIAANPRLRGQLLYPDQDVINLIALQHGCQRLSSRWNHQLIHGAHASVSSEQDASETPAILHFAGEVKPWKSWYPSGAAKEAYWHWRQQANQCLGGVMTHEPDPPASRRDHWVAFHLWHRQGHYPEASHSAAALLQSLPAPPP